MARLALPIHSYQHSSRPVGCERLVNCYAEQAPPEGKAPTIVTRSPGVVYASTLTDTGIGQGIFEWNGVLYVAVSGQLFSMNSSGVFSSIGLIGTTDQVSWGVNATQLVICTAPDAYVYDGTTLTQISDADFTSRGGAQVVSLDGYVIFREPNTGRFFSSDLNDALSYNGLAFATAEGFPDNLIGMIVDHRQIILGGANSVELWFNAGASPFPFERDVNGFIELGVAAGNSFAKADNSVYWLASDLTVRRLEGLTPVRVSQHGVEQAIRSYTTSDATALSYTQDGHVFYVLTFPTDGHTWVYDATTREWHERETYGYSRWRVASTAFCYGRQYVQYFDSGLIGYLDPGTYTDAVSSGEPAGPLRAEWTYGSVYDSGRRTFHSNLEALIESGVGLTSGQGSDPEIMLDVSDDGGRTWRARPTQKIGKIGKYRTRVNWAKLGSSRDRVYRMAVSDPVKVTVSDTQLDVA